MPPLPVMRSGAHPSLTYPCPVSNISNYLTSRTNPPAQPHQPARPTAPTRPPQPHQPARPTRPAKRWPSRAQPGCGAAVAPASARGNTTSHTRTTRHAISDRSPVLVAITTKTGERSAIPHYVPGACQATVHRGAHQEHHAHLKSSSAPSPHPRPRAILTEESCASLRLPPGAAPFTSPASCAPAFLPGPFPAGLE